MAISKKLTLLDSTMLIMGSMIGSGIFIVPAAMSRELGSPHLVLWAWAATALLTVLAAICYGELAALMPKAGGQYVYLKEAYHPLFGFLYGWTLFTVIQTGTIAAVAVAFAKFSGVFFSDISQQNVLVQIAGIQISTQQLLAIIIIWILTVFNFGEVKRGALLQNVFTFTKVGAIVFMIAAGIYYISIHEPLTTVTQTVTIPEVDFWGVFCVALVGSIFSSDAWNNITFTGSEIEKPERTLPFSLLLGTVSVLSIYLLINWIYISVLPFNQIQHAENDRVGTALLQTIMGEKGKWAMAALIMISTFGCINGLTLSGARVYYAMARDGLFFAKASSLNKSESPQFALLMQAAWTSILTLSGSYGDLLDYVVFAVLLFYILTVAGIFLLRKKQPCTPRPYKVWGYPFTPIAYIVMASFICIQLLLRKPDYTYPGLGIVLAGIPIYYLIKRKS